MALAVVIPLTSASAGTTLTPLHITKECSQFTGDTPSFCTITGSDLDAIPVGTKVMYWGPVLTDPNFMSSRAVLRAGHGNRAFGYCQTIADPYHGTCTFWKGTGTLSRGSTPAWTSRTSRVPTSTGTGPTSSADDGR